MALSQMITCVYTALQLLSRTKDKESIPEPRVCIVQADAAHVWLDGAVRKVCVSRAWRAMPASEGVLRF